MKKGKTSKLIGFRSSKVVYGTVDSKSCDMVCVPLSSVYDFLLPGTYKSL
jgi:hypothetical protein